MEKSGWTASLLLLVRFKLERNAQREYQGSLLVSICCHLIVLCLLFYMCFVFSLAVSCHFMWLSVLLQYPSSWGSSASIKEIRSFIIFVSKLSDKQQQVHKKQQQGRDFVEFRRDSRITCGFQLNLRDDYAQKKEKEDSSMKESLDLDYVL